MENLIEMDDLEGKPPIFWKHPNPKTKTLRFECSPLPVSRSKRLPRSRPPDVSVELAGWFHPQQICHPPRIKEESSNKNVSQKKKNPGRFKNGRFSDLYGLTNQAFFTRTKTSGKLRLLFLPETRDILYISVEKRTVQSSRFQGFFVQIALFGFLFGQVSLGPYLGSFA